MGFEVLLVEDDPNDALLFARILSTSAIPVKLAVTRDAGEVMDFLDSVDQGTKSPPSLVVVDSSVRQSDGTNVLSFLKSTRKFAAIPVVVLSGRDAPSDIAQAYIEGANAYLVKPTGYKELEALLRSTFQFWLQFARLPDPARR